MLCPTRCAGCDRPGALLCDACRDALPLIDPARACPLCGAPEGARWCGECPREAFAFAAVRSAGVLEAPLARAVALHKDAGERRLAAILGGLAADAAADWAATSDAVVGVPATAAAIARRGYDHGSALAAEVASLLGLPALDVLASRRRLDQRTLRREQRIANMRGSLRVVAGVTVPRHPILVDDVLTTGATLDAAAHALLEAGAIEVRAITVARTA